MGNLSYSSFVLMVGMSCSPPLPFVFSSRPLISETELVEMSLSVSNFFLTISVTVFSCGRNICGPLSSDANNVLNAAKEVEPFGIDLCSGVRENGKLNEKRLEEFFNSIMIIQA